jgi:DNA-binding GntR family transcriptional regulator
MAGERPSRASLLARTTTGEQVADALREQIMLGDLAPGAPMREVTLADDFGVSRKTVQDALAVLASERLIRHERHRGSKVAELSRVDVEDLYRVRLTLEGEAARIAGNFTHGAVDRLGAAFNDLEIATTIGKADEIVRHDLEFHRAVVGLIGSERLDAFFAEIAVEMRYALSILESAYKESSERPAAALDEHRAIRDALLSGDPDLSSLLVSEHVITNRDRLIRVVDRRSPG